MIETVIFDLGGVYFSGGSAKAIERISATYDIPADLVTDVLMGDLGSRYRLGEILQSSSGTEQKQPGSSGSCG